MLTSNSFIFSVRIPPICLQCPPDGSPGCKRTRLWSTISTIAASLPSNGPEAKRTTRPTSTSLQALAVTSTDPMLSVFGRLWRYSVVVGRCRRTWAAPSQIRDSPRTNSCAWLGRLQGKSGQSVSLARVCRSQSQGSVCLCLWGRTVFFCMLHHVSTIHTALTCTWHHTDCHHCYFLSAGASVTCLRPVGISPAFCTCTLRW